MSGTGKFEGVKMKDKFIELVSRMRRAQQVFILKRRPDYAAQKRALEKEVDRFLLSLRKEEE